MPKAALAVKYCHLQCECTEAALGKVRGPVSGKEMHFVLFAKKTQQSEPLKN